MPVEIRAFELSDADQVAGLYQTLATCDPGAGDAWRQRERDLDEGGRPVCRRVAADTCSGEVVVYARAWNTFAPRKFRVALVVHPRRQRQGIGTRLLDWALAEVVALGGISLQARARDDQAGILAFWQRRGFVETHRMVSLRLPLSGVDLAALASLEGRLAKPGIAVTTRAAEQARDPDCLRRPHALDEASHEGRPDPDPTPDPVPAPPVTRSYEEFERNLWRLGTLPEAFFLAMRDGEYLGYSGLAPCPQMPGAFVSAGTAVHPAHRGRGIATELKIRTLAAARAYGAVEIRTSSANPAMIAINEKLGFRREGAEIRLVRTIHAPGALGGSADSGAMWSVSCGERSISS